MEIPIVVKLDVVQANIEEFMLTQMQKNGISPSVMDKVLDGVQSNIRRLKAEEYAETIEKLLHEQRCTEQKIESKTGTAQELRSDFMQTGARAAEQGTMPANTKK